MMDTHSNRPIIWTSACALAAALVLSSSTLAQEGDGAPPKPGAQETPKQEEAPVKEEDPPKKPVEEQEKDETDLRDLNPFPPPGGSGPSSADELKDLFVQVEKRLNRVTELLYEASSGDMKGADGIGGDGIDALIREAESGAAGAQSGIARMLEATRGPSQATLDDIERVMNRVDTIYERDCDVTFQLTNIIIRNNPNDPYTTNDAGNLLGQFRSFWNANFNGTRKDLAHLFTGKNLQGGTIGVAFLNAVCNQTLGYGLSESRFTGNQTSRAGQTAHEIGHNFNRNHCNGSSDCRIMCASLGGCAGDRVNVAAHFLEHKRDLRLDHCQRIQVQAGSTSKGNAAFVRALAANAVFMRVRIDLVEGHGERVR